MDNKQTTIIVHVLQIEIKITSTPFFYENYIYK
jgi:hypothetical protein